MDRQDDPTITGATVLLRRIPPWAERVIWDEHGNPEATKQNFKDKIEELSLHIASETTPDQVLAGPNHDGFGLMQISVEQIREVFQQAGASVVICRDDEDPSNGHVLVCGHITNGMANKLRNKATWVEGRWPRRVGPLE